MSKVYVMFKLINGDRFIKIFMVADSESTKDTIDTFLYRYNMCCLFYVWTLWLWLWCL